MPETKNQTQILGAEWVDVSKLHHNYNVWRLTWTIPLEFCLLHASWRGLGRAGMNTLLGFSEPSYPVKMLQMNVTVCQEATCDLWDKTKI